MPTLPEILEAGVTRRLRGLHTAAFGVMTSHIDSVCTVQLAQIDGETPAPIESVPVVLAGDWQDGDPCLCVFSEEQFGDDLASTGNARRHGLYAVAIPLVARPGQATDFVALAQLVIDNFNILANAISTAVVVAGDGGASFKADILSSLAADGFPVAVAAERLRAR